MKVNAYLALAYSFLWLLLMLYVWSLSRRQARVKRELEELRERVARDSSSQSAAS